MEKMLRLDKLLCEMGLGSRSEIKKAIQKGAVKIDGKVCTQSDLKLVPKDHSILYHEKEVAYQAFSYLMMNKPMGYISATEDRKQKTVMDLLSDVRKDLSIVGRLDIDTEGLLLLTNDGELNHDLLSPKNHVDKQYEFVVDTPMPMDTELIFKNGVLIDDEDGSFMALPAKLERITDTKGLLTICEGKYHQVKRMLMAVGCKVIYLKRRSIGPLLLDEKLSLGEYRELSEDEIQSLKNRKK